MKTRFKSSVVYHAEPEVNKCFLAKSEVLENKLKRGSITKEELLKLVDFRIKHRIKPEVHQYFIPVWGNLVEVSKEEYERYFSK